MLTGFAIGVFLTPNKIVDGGVSGIATVLYHKFLVQPGITIFLSNILLLITGLKILGKNFTERFEEPLSYRFLRSFFLIFLI